MPPSLYPPCVKPHFATNLGTHATLHDYHLDGDEVNADSGRIWGEMGGNPR
jgi:hypothetical protein